MRRIEEGCKNSSGCLLEGGEKDMKGKQEGELHGVDTQLNYDPGAAVVEPELNSEDSCSGEGNSFYK